MALDLEQLKFGAEATTIAEEELGASFSEDENNQLIKSLYREYTASSDAGQRKDWLRNRLAELFACIDEQPKWIEKSSVPQWPFCNGVPMVFIQQIKVPRTPVSEVRVVPDAMLYVFGTRSEQVDGWLAKYRVVEQQPDLP